MEEGDEGTEIPPEVLAQTDDPSESVDGTDKDTGRQEDSDEGTNGRSTREQLGTCKVTTGCVQQQSNNDTYECVSDGIHVCRV